MGTKFADRSNVEYGICDTCGRKNFSRMGRCIKCRSKICDKCGVKFSQTQIYQTTCGRCIGKRNRFIARNGE